MKIDEYEISDILQEAEDALDDGDVDTAKNKIKTLRQSLAFDSNSEELTAGFVINIWSPNYTDEIYFVTSRHQTILDGLADIVADHIPKLVSPSCEEYEGREAQSEIEKSNHAVSKATYKKVDIDEEISIHADVYYQRCRVFYDGNQSGIIRDATPKDIISEAKRQINRSRADHETVSDPIPHTLVDDRKYQDLTEL